MICVVTGAAGFIGSQVIETFLELGYQVRGIDCLTNNYSRLLKENNLKIARSQKSFSFIEQNIIQADLNTLLDGAEVVVHLAAEAGVRHSWGDNFQFYIQNNLITTQLILESIKKNALTCRLVYASSSSVYGDNEDLPLVETSVCLPISPYGVTKLAAEHLCTLYHKNFGIETISLRYFTVYGPRQRPDMAFHRFIKAILEGTEITLYGDGEQSRDFTYIDDVVKATVIASTTKVQANIFNIGGGSRISINKVLAILEKIIGAKAIIKRLKSAKGDVQHTYADTNRARLILGYKPQIDLPSGLDAEVKWIYENKAFLYGILK